MKLFRPVLLLSMLMVPMSLQAHLLPKQNVTMKILDNSANFVVSVPISALPNVDENKDGKASLREIRNQEKWIEQQFKSGFTITNNGKKGTDLMVMAMPPETDGDHHHHSDYVVILYRVQFDEIPNNPIISTNLFGTHSDEGKMVIRATMGVEKELATLTPALNWHEFFKKPNI
ncbi:hypothetical protein LPB140_03645 [Sphingorhabdus lutea]|uniref:DUF2796 domain-containing protein n=1 Tax=Sphingorhabdus lutea TaxID=1913578 RepID=A0A1L3JAB4_9SPHN|nr:hypothetical protein [Sphingorhabdus lutea]APG62059.1 hypothetical protein LPB140_03645 [Sphingorhabdus lutea]